MRNDVKAAGLATLTLLVGLSLFGWVLLAVRVSQLWLALVLAVLATVLVARASSRRWVWISAAVLVASLAGALACNWFYDLSWDGQAYHQEAVLRIAAGWNPIWGAPLGADRRPIDIWVNCYPQAAWIAEAVLYRSSGLLEASKVINFLGMGAALLLGQAALRALGVTRWKAWGVSVLAALNPVALTQGLTFYVDGLLASLFTVVAALTVLWWRKPRGSTLAALGATLIVVSNLKFTGLVYAGMYAAGLSAAVWLRHREQRRTFVLGIGAVMAIAVVAVGYSPYVKNLRAYHHPFFPIAGPGAVDVMPISVAPELLAAGRPVRLARSLLSRSANDLEPPKWKIPFAIHTGELVPFSAPDVRIGGFGPWFGAAALLALLSLALAWALRVPGVLCLTLVCGLILSSVFLNAGLSVARYVPQLWLAVVIVLIPARPRALAIVIGATLAIDVLLVGKVHFPEQAFNTRILRSNLEMAAAASAHAPVPVHIDGFDSNRERFRAAGVKFVEHAELPCAHPKLLTHSTTKMCF
jgi:hypothetical protein